MENLTRIQKKIAKRQEKTFELFKFSSVKVKQISEKDYEW